MTASSKRPKQKRRRKLVFNPVASRVRVIADHPYDEWVREKLDPIDNWLQRTPTIVEMGKQGRTYRRKLDLFPYDRDAMAVMQSVRGNKVSARGLRGMIERIVPTLSPDRKALLAERMDSLLMQRKSVLDRDELVKLGAMLHHGKRRTKKEKRRKPNPLKQLKALLRSK